MEGGAGNTLEDSAAVQSDPARLEERADRNFIKFNWDKYNILHLGGTGIPAAGQAEN